MSELRDKVEKNRRWLESATPATKKPHPLVDIFFTIDDEIEKIKKSGGGTGFDGVDILQREVNKLMEAIVSIQKDMVDQERTLEAALQEIKENREQIRELERNYQQALQELLALLRNQN